jgi:hypothetical protein
MTGLVARFVNYLPVTHQPFGDWPFIGSLRAAAGVFLPKPRPLKKII